MNNFTVCILVMAHKSLEYIFILAKNNPGIVFYIHFDAKSELPKTELDNIVFIDDRVDVRWGGYSQVNAILNLLNFAVKNSKCEYFHLISGEDVILSTNENMLSKLSWHTNEIFMECKYSSQHNYRVRFSAIHADSNWQRKIPGKILTLLLKILDFSFFSKRKYLFGSNWFSIRRNELNCLLSNIEKHDINFFKNRLNPDEHFFQYILEKSNLCPSISALGNKRYIVFDKEFNNGNNPVYLKSQCLNDVFLMDKCFFARKVDVKNQIKFYELVNLK